MGSRSGDSGPGKLTCKGNIWTNKAQLTIADANVACDQLCGNDRAADVLIVKNATVKATRVSAFGGGITLEGCAITSPKGASIDGGRIVLVKANNVDIDMDAVRSRFAFSLPEGCTLDLSNPREIAVNVPSRRGTIISFK